MDTEGGNLGHRFAGVSSAGAVADARTHLVRSGFTPGLGGFPPCGVAGGVHLGLRWLLLFMPCDRHW